MFLYSDLMALTLFIFQWIDWVSSITTAVHLSRSHAIQGPRVWTALAQDLNL